MRPCLTILPAIACAAFAAACSAQQPLVGTAILAPALQQLVDRTVSTILGRTGVPSAQVGLVQNGKIVYTAAFGLARLQPPLPATPAMHYAVGSISKQFTATCILLLQQDGKLSLEDPVARWFPELTRANEITLRMLLSHTSGYSDYAPQDYTIPLWTHPGDPLKLVHQWAGKPLDFEPGTRWQYSNTNFVLAALIVQKTSGVPFFQFLSTRVLQPLHLRDIIDLDTDRQHMEVTGYMRNALAPLRPAVLEAPGWYFGDGSLAMPVADLLRWDISIMDQALLKPESYQAFETEVKLADGQGSHYGLGVQVGTRDGHRVVFHSGEVGGFVAQNTILPDDKIAVAVLTNQEASDAAAEIAHALLPLLLTAATPEAGTDPAVTAAAETQLRTLLNGLEEGRLDRSLLTPDCNFYFSKDAVADFQTSLKPLGSVTAVHQTSTELRGGMRFRAFAVTLSTRHVTVTTYTMPDGKLEQFLVETSE